MSEKERASERERRRVERKLERERKREGRTKIRERRERNRVKWREKEKKGRVEQGHDLVAMGQRVATGQGWPTAAQGGRRPAGRRGEDNGRGWW